MHPAYSGPVALFLPGLAGDPAYSGPVSVREMHWWGEAGFSGPPEDPEAHNAIYLDPDAPTQVKQLGTASMTGCSIAWMMRCLSPWRLTPHIVLSNDSTIAGKGRVVVQFGWGIYSVEAWQLILTHREVEGGPIYETRWRVPFAAFDTYCHSFAITHNDGTGAPQAYLDGVELVPEASSWAPLVGGATSVPLYVLTYGEGGASGLPQWSMHNVTVGAFKVWDRDLTKAQLLAELGWGAPIDTTGMLLYYDFREQTGSIAHDWDGVLPAKDLDLDATDRWRVVHCPLTLPCPLILEPVMDAGFVTCAFSVHWKPDPVMDEGFVTGTIGPSGPGNLIRFKNMAPQPLPVAYRDLSGGIHLVFLLPRNTLVVSLPNVSYLFSYVWNFVRRREARVFLNDVKQDPP